jgi:hypothetical protein
VNGGTKLQELPEIKNCVTGTSSNSLKGKERNFIVQRLWSKSLKNVSKGREACLLQAGSKEN